MIARDESVLAREGLALARREGERAELESLEGRRARVDAGQPKLSVSVDSSVEYGLRRPLVMSFGGDRDEGRGVDGEPVVRLDGHDGSDQQRSVAGRVVGRVSNDAGMRAAFTIHDANGRHVDDGEVAVGESAEFKLVVSSWAGDWMRRYRADFTSQEAERLAGFLRYVSPGDRGVVCIWPIRMRGSLLVPEGEGSDYWIGGAWGDTHRPTARAWIPEEQIERVYFFTTDERRQVLSDLDDRFRGV